MDCSLEEYIKLLEKAKQPEKAARFKKMRSERDAENRGTLVVDRKKQKVHAKIER